MGLFDSINWDALYALNPYNAAGADILSRGQGPISSGNLPFGLGGGGRQGNQTITNIQEPWSGMQPSLLSYYNLVNQLINRTASQRPNIQGLPGQSGGNIYGIPTRGTGGR